MEMSSAEFLKSHGATDLLDLNFFWSPAGKTVYYALRVARFERFAVAKPRSIGIARCGNILYSRCIAGDARKIKLLSMPSLHADDVLHCGRRIAALWN